MYLKKALIKWCPTMVFGRRSRVGSRLGALLFFTLVAVCSPPLVVRAAEKADRPASNGLETIDVFRAGEGGYRTYRIPALAITRKGTLLAACAARLDGFNDWVNIDTMLRRS